MRVKQIEEWSFICAQLWTWLSIFILSYHVGSVNSLPTAGLPSNSPLLFEGDILLDTYAKQKQYLKAPATIVRRKRSISNRKFRPWRHAIVPFVISPKLGKQARLAIKRAIATIEQNSCVVFTQRLTQVDYLEFIQGEGCYSEVGRKGGKQVLSIGPGCEYQSIVLHELLHTLGYLHEHTRYDRDLYIEILWWNIQDGADKNFIAHGHGFQTFAKYPYDFNSILHYGSREFSKNGHRTIRSISKPGIDLGSKGTLSKLDIKKLNDSYKCFRRRSKRIKLLRQCNDKLRSCKSFATYKKYCQSHKMFALLYCPMTCQLCS